MLKSLTIKNFKSYEDTSLKFSAGINAIIGRPNHGKTNVLRALLKLFKNRPLGGDFLFSGAGRKGIVEIEANFDNATVRLENSIFTNKDGKKQVKNAKYVSGERKFETMNKGVPDLVGDIINLTDLNIQEQLDQPFLITSSAGEIAKTVNRITGQDKADELEKRFTTKINSANKEIKFIESEINDKTEELKKYEKVDDLDSVVATIEEFQEVLERDEENLEKILILSRRFTETKEEIEYLQEFKSVGDIIKEIELLQKDAEEKKIIYNVLIEYNYINEDITELKLLIDPLADLIAKIEEENKKIDLNNNKSNLLYDYNEAKIEEKELKDRKKVYLDKYIKELKSRKICPTCYSTINDKIIEKIRREL